MPPVSDGIFATVSVDPDPVKIIAVIEVGTAIGAKTLHNTYVFRVLYPEIAE